MAEDKNIAIEEESDGAVFDENAFASAPTDDEASLLDAMNANPFKLFFLRNFIKTKNHLAVLPMLVVVSAMIVLTTTLIHHDEAVGLLIYDNWNALLLFVNVLASILAILAYMQVSSRKSTKKKKIAMSVVFYAIVALELYIDFRYVHYLDVQMSLVNAVRSITDNANHDIAMSRVYTLVHAVLLIVAVVLSALAPLLQPYARKIHIKVK